MMLLFEPPTFDSRISAQGALFAIGQKSLMRSRSDSSGDDPSRRASSARHETHDEWLRKHPSLCVNRVEPCAAVCRRRRGVGCRPLPRFLMQASPSAAADTVG